MTSRQPNIIFILTDQQRADTIGYDGNDHMITPNMDKLASEGVMFRQCFTQGACCMPARAALFAAKYAHQLNLLSNAPLWDGEDNWVKLLAEAGYQTASIGKMHLKPWRSPCGFEYRFMCENKNEPWAPGVEPDEWVKHLAEHGLERPLDYPETMPDFFDRMGDVDFPLDEEFHEDVFIGNKVLDWIDNRQDDRPLFLHIGFAGPHDPFDAPQRYKDLYADRDIPAPNAVPGEVDSKPPEQRAALDRWETLAVESTIRMSHATPERLRGMRAAYYAGVTLIDEYIGKILDAIKARGLLDDAIVILCSDHGGALGDNEMVYKWFMYDSITRVPMVLWGPKYFGQGRSDELVELIDIAPTILELTGISAPDDMPAKSFAPALKDSGSFRGKDYVFCEEKHLVMVRSTEWKLVHYHGQDYGELYDLVNDPHESNNLFDDPARENRKAELVAVMEGWYAQTGGRCAALDRYI